MGIDIISVFNPPDKTIRSENCSYCDGVTEHIDEFNGYRGKFNFCPICGRRIKEN